MESLEGPNPLAGLSSEALFNAAYTLTLGCNGTRAILKRKHRRDLCAVQEILLLELDRRAQSKPQWPYKA